MNTLFNKYSNDLFNTAAKISVFLLLAFAAGSIRAQSINDDLQPKKPNVKPSVRPRPAKQPAKPTIRPAGRRPPFRKVQPVDNKINNPPAENPPVNNQPVENPPVAPPTPAAPAQTPEQIIERFMDFQQSSDVTTKDWESVAAQTQSDSSDAQTKAQYFIAQGYIAYSRADFSSALVQFKTAAQVLPDSALPFYSVGTVYLVTKQPNQAQIAFEKAIKLNKKFALAYKGLGDALTAQNKNKKAQENYDEAARIGAANAIAPSNPAAGASGNSSVNKPVDSTTLTPESATDLELKSARTLTTQKKWQSSLDKLLPLAENKPTADAYIAIGDNYFGMEQWLSALQAYRRATELNSASAPAFYKSGMVLFETNEFQSAAEAFEKALILDQNGMSINRPMARKMADRASEKAKDIKGKGKIKKKNFLGM